VTALKGASTLALSDTGSFERRQAPSPDGDLAANPPGFDRSRFLERLGSKLSGYLVANLWGRRGRWLDGRCGFHGGRGKAACAEPPSGFRSAVGARNKLRAPTPLRCSRPWPTPRNSSHSLRSCHSDTRGEPEVEAREYARGQRALRFSPPPMRPAGGSAQATSVGDTVDRPEPAKRSTWRAYAVDP